MEGRSVVCAVMSGSRTNGWLSTQLHGGHFTFHFYLRTFVIFSWIKLLVYHLRACPPLLPRCACLPHTLYFLMVIAHWASVGCQRIESDALTSCNRVGYTWYWVNVCITTLQVTRAFSWHLPLHCMPSLPLQAPWSSPLTSPLPPWSPFTPH